MVVSHHGCPACSQGTSGTNLAALQSEISEGEVMGVTPENVSECLSTVWGVLWL